MRADLAALDETIANLTRRLLENRVSAGRWEGELSSSALSTATAVSALALADAAAHAPLIAAGARWLAANRNGDGGWGDTVASRSNISTTALCWGALGLAGREGSAESRAAESWL